MLEDDEQTSEMGGSTRATSVDSKISPVTLQSSHHREQVKTHGCLSTYTTEPTIEPIDRPTSHNTVLPQRPCGRVVSEEDHRAAAVAGPPSAITPPLSQQSQAPNASLEEQEWEIQKIIGKRRVEKGYEYMVRWNG